MLSNNIQIYFKRLITTLCILLLAISTYRTKPALKIRLSHKNIAIFSFLMVLILSHFISTIRSNHEVSAIPNVPTNDNILTPLPTVNHQPVANAGINQTVNENTTVMLNGIASDPDPGDYNKLAYLWKQIAGPPVNLSNNTNTSPSFVAPTVPEDRELKFLLTVKDDKGAENNNSAIVTVTVKHINRSPLANAGVNHTVNPGDIVTLDGSKSSDLDVDPLTYSWMQTDGPRVTLDNVNTSIASFTTPSKISSDTDLIFKLIVNDTKNATSTDDVKVTIKHTPLPNKPPVANAGLGQTVNAGDPIKLDGTASKDPDGNVTSYLWEQIAGSHITLNGTDTATPSFTAPSNVSTNTVLVFQLTVTDDKNATSISPVKITVKPANRSPIANAGVNQTVNAGDVITLDGSKSNDPDNDQIKYLWKQIAGTPVVTINGADKPIATFTAPNDLSSDTQLTFELTASDNKNGKSTATSQVTVKYVTPNKPPVADAGTDETVNSGDYVTLEGTGSKDLDGTITSYSWNQTGGPTIQLYNNTNPIANFFADTVYGDTTLKFTLTVKDDMGLTSYPDVVTITIKAAEKAPVPETATTTTNMTIPDNTTVVDNVGNFNAKADELYNQERYQEAIEWYDKALAINPNDVYALYSKGGALHGLGRYQEAIEWYDKALAINPSYEDALGGKGGALHGLGRYQEAIVWYDKALAIDPNDVYELSGKGDALLNLERYQEAIVWYDKAIAINPNYVSALVGKGDALLNLERYQEAIVWYDKALAIYPNNTNVLSVKAFTLSNMGRNEEALPLAEKALESDPNNEVYLANKAFVLYNLGRTDEAKSYYNKALQIDPNLTQILTDKELAVFNSLIGPEGPTLIPSPTPPAGTTNENEDTTNENEEEE